MKLFAKLLLVAAVVAFAVLALFVIRKGAHLLAAESVTLTPAPPALEDSGPAPALPEPPAGAIVFDLKYRAETGAKDDIQYHSFWGFGGSDDPKDPFIQEVRRRAKKVQVVDNSMLPGRQRSAVEYEGKKALAFYFDLNADGKLTDSERILPTRKAGDAGVEFITPDFMLKTNDGREVKFRVLLRAEFYGQNNEPNCMWSPACVLEGNSTINGKPARMVLFADGFSAAFDHFGASSCALPVGAAAGAPQEYLPRETLSRLVRCEGQFYRLKLEGKRSSGHRARAVLTRDTSPVGGLAIKLASTNALQTTANNLILVGANDSEIYFNLPDLKHKLPVGAYRLQRGTLGYGEKGSDEWQMTFSDGPTVTLAADKQTDVILGEPTLAVRAMDQDQRYGPRAKEATTFKKSARIYLEPRIVGKNKEVLTGFSRAGKSGGQRESAPPKVTITAADGKQVLAKTMEYG
jgi:hypothetical protein